MSLLRNPRSKIIVSLDGPPWVNSQFRAASQYEQVMRWLPSTLTKASNQVVVLSTLHRGNFASIPSFAAALADCGLIHYHVTLLKRLGGAECGHIGFISRDDAMSLEAELLDIAHKHAGFAPVLHCRFFGTDADGLSRIPISAFTEYHCGSGMKIMPSGRIGISQMVYFSRAFAAAIPDAHLRSLGHVDAATDLRHVWLGNDNRALRVAQADVATRYYPYFVGWAATPDEALTAFSRSGWADTAQLGIGD
jgi:MoaA/NifB/PqqE/SkfB family radical SAM enzyme